MNISDCILANLHRLDGRTISVNRQNKVGTAIERFNDNLSKLSVELNGIDYESDQTELIKNPFSKPLVKHQSQGSVVKWGSFCGTFDLEIKY
jgi:hypothetical protein